MKKTVKQLPSGVWAIINEKGTIHVYTNSEYEQLKWWDKVKIKYFS